MGENDKERSEAMKDFYQIYRPLQKKYNLRMHSYFSIYEDGYIEIWEYCGEVRGNRICMAKDGEEAACYRRAIEDLKSYENSRKGRDNVRKC